MTTKSREKKMKSAPLLVGRPRFELGTNGLKVRCILERKQPDSMGSKYGTQDKKATCGGLRAFNFTESLRAIGAGLLLLGSCALTAGASVAQGVDAVPMAKIEGGQCVYTYTLRPHETQFVYCDGSGGRNPTITAIAVSGNNLVLAYVARTYNRPLGVVVVLRNQTGKRQAGEVVTTVVEVGDK